MKFSDILRSARRAAHLTQADLAARTGIARPNIAAYEADRREPRFTTADSLLTATGAIWEITEPITWSWTATRRPYAVPSRLWRLSASAALCRIETENHLWWSGPPRTFDLSQRRQRLRAYEIVLREGGPVDIGSIVDELLLREAWPDLVLPAALRDAWQPLLDPDIAPKPALSRVP
jgi:transcriptional regulator with XRE-family HTH domain